MNLVEELANEYAQYVARAKRCRQNKSEYMWYKGYVTALGKQLGYSIEEIKEDLEGKIRI